MYFWCASYLPIFLATSLPHVCRSLDIVGTEARCWLSRLVSATTAPRGLVSLGLQDSSPLKLKTICDERSGPISFHFILTQRLQQAEPGEGAYDPVSLVGRCLSPLLPTSCLVGHGATALHPDSLRGARPSTHTTYMWGWYLASQTGTFCHARLAWPAPFRITVDPRPFICSTDSTLFILHTLQSC